MKPHPFCRDCGYRTESEAAEVCQKCCDHSDTDHHYCLICDKDMVEEFAAQAKWARDCAEDR
jgi:hypothetical protein